MKKYISAAIGVGAGLSLFGALFISTPLAAENTVTPEPQNATIAAVQNKLVDLGSSSEVNSPAVFSRTASTVAQTQDPRISLLTASLFFLFLALGVIYARKSSLKKINIRGTEIYQMQSLLGSPKHSRVR